MCDLVCKPERNQLWLETKCAGIRIGLTGEMLERDEGHSATVDHELASVCSTHTNHEDYIGIDIGLEDSAALRFGEASQRNDVDAREHGTKVIAVCVSRGANYFLEVRALGIEDVVRPVGLEYSAMSFEVAQISCDAIGAVYDSEEIWEQVDQHRRQENTAFGNAQQE
jgi:hypothetical protein